MKTYSAPHRPSVAINHIVFAMGFLTTFPVILKPLGVTAQDLKSYVPDLELRYLTSG